MCLCVCSCECVYSVCTCECVYARLNVCMHVCTCACELMIRNQGVSPRAPTLQLAWNNNPPPKTGPILSRVSQCAAVA